MPLGAELDLGPGDILSDGDPADPSPQKRAHCPAAPHFSAYVYCGQTAEWTKMPIGTEVCFGPSHIVLD